MEGAFDWRLVCVHLSKKFSAMYFERENAFLTMAHIKMDLFQLQTFWSDRITLDVERDLWIWH